MAGVIAAALVEVAGVVTVVKNGSGARAGLEGLAEEMAVIAGRDRRGRGGADEWRDLHGRREWAGRRRGCSSTSGRTHAFVAQLARGARVLDVFSHVGGFGLAALAGGAASALAVDGSAAALGLAAEGAAAKGVARPVRARGRAMRSMCWRHWGPRARAFDVVVCDPPAFAPSKQALEAGLRA